MKCEVCKNGRLSLNHVKLVLSSGPSREVVFKNLPVRICQNCGEEFMSHSTMNKIMEIMDQTDVMEVCRPVKRVIGHRCGKACSNCSHEGNTATQ